MNLEKQINELKAEIKEIFNEYELSDLLEVCKDTEVIKDHMYKVFDEMPDEIHGDTYDETVHENIIKLMFEIWNLGEIIRFKEFLLNLNIEFKKYAKFMKESHTNKENTKPNPMAIRRKKLYDLNKKSVKILKQFEMYELIEAFGLEEYAKQYAADIKEILEEFETDEDPVELYQIMLLTHGFIIDFILEFYNLDEIKEKLKLD